MWTILIAIAIGVAAAWGASLLVHGAKSRRDWALFLTVGIGGALIGGLLTNLIAGNGLGLGIAGVIGSAVCAVVPLWFVTRAQNKVRRRVAARAARRALRNDLGRR